MIRCNLCWKKLSSDDDDDDCPDGMWYDTRDDSLFPNKVGSNALDEQVQQQESPCCYITSCSHILCESCAKKAWEKVDSDSLVCPACDSPLVMKNIFPTNLAWRESNALALLGFNPINCK